MIVLGVLYLGFREKRWLLNVSLAAMSLALTLFLAEGTLGMP